MSGKLGGGQTRVSGYNQTIAFAPGWSSSGRGVINTAPELPAEEYNYLVERFDVRTVEYMAGQYVCMPDNEHQLHPGWIASHTISNVASAVPPVLDFGAISTDALADYEEYYDKAPPSRLWLDAPISFNYEASGEYGAKLYHKNEDGSKTDVTRTDYIGQ